MSTKCVRYYLKKYEDRKEKSQNSLFLRRNNNGTQLKKKDEITKGFRILQQGGSHILCSPVTLAYTLFH